MQESEVNKLPTYKPPEERTMGELIKSSVIIIDKNSGPTSHQISAWVKSIFGVNKTGHAGTLDPAVTGVLPIALGNSVKVMPLLMGLRKEYVGVMHVHHEVSEETLRSVISEKFLGKIRQTPPVKSAVARREREREIYFFEILEASGKDVLFRVGCEAGTYIRKLCSDVGNALGTGAHMSELRRTVAGNFTEEDAHPLLEVKDAYEFWKGGDEERLRRMLIPIERAVGHVKKIFVKDSAVPSIVNGAPLYVKGIDSSDGNIVEGESVCMFDPRSVLIAFGIAKMNSKSMQERKKGVALRTDRVIVERGM